MHIVHTEASQGWGGQEIRILTESVGMMARGHQITLLTPEKARIYQVAQDMGVPVVAMPFEKKRPKGVAAFKQWVIDNQPDVVNTHSSIDSWLVALSQPFSKRIPVVRTRHISAPLPKSIATRWLYMKAADAVATTGERLRQTMIKDLNADPRHFTSVPTGIDMQRYSLAQAKPSTEIRKELGIPEQAIVVCIAATIRSWKGHSYLVDAFAELSAQYDNLYLLIVGDGPIRELIQQQVNDLVAHQRVIMTGHSERVEDMLAAADIFCLPSWANEGVPQAIMQAMAMELPVVSTDVGAIDEVLKDQYTGLQVKSKSSEAISQAIRHIINNPDEGKRWGKNGRLTIENGYSSQHMVEAMEEIFFSVTKGKNK